MRTVKEPDVRRTEILDAAEALFVTKGYRQTTIVDILERIGIAKGTFYHYFRSKEEVMDAVIGRIVEQDVLRAKRIQEDGALSPPQKFCAVLLAQKPAEGDRKEQMLRQFHQPRNAEMHQKSLVLSIQGVAPILAGIVEEGIAHGIFSTPYPQETVEFLLVSGQVLFDRGLFQWDMPVYARKAQAFVRNMEVLLGAQAGSFDFMKEIFACG